MKKIRIKMFVTSLLHIVPIVLILILPFFGLFFVIKNQHVIIQDSVSEAKQNGNVQAVSHITASPIPTIEQFQQIDTGNWKTYISSHGYSVKYPTDMKMSDQQGFDIQLKNKDLLLSIGVFGLAQNKTVDDYVRYGLCLSDPFHGTINNKTIYRSETKYNNGNICEDGVFQFNDFNIIDLQGKANNATGVNVYKQIIATFLFTN